VVRAVKPPAQARAILARGLGHRVRSRMMSEGLARPDLWDTALPFA
jgi:hypothetical protein